MKEKQHLNFSYIYENLRGRAEGGEKKLKCIKSYNSSIIYKDEC